MIAMSRLLPSIQAPCLFHEPCSRGIFWIKEHLSASKKRHGLASLFVCHNGIPNLRGLSHVNRRGDAFECTIPCGPNPPKLR
jgi:hypothetical protein